MADYEKKSDNGLNLIFHNPNTKEKYEKYIKKILTDKLLCEYKNKV